jgi:hypothetical protein
MPPVPGRELEQRRECRGVCAELEQHPRELQPQLRLPPGFTFCQK